MNKGPGEKRVLDFLKENYPDYYNAPVIAKYLKLKPNSVNTYLNRLYKNGSIIRQDNIKVYYRYSDPAENKAIDFNDINCKCPTVMHTFYMFAEIEEGFISTLLENEGRSPPQTSLTNSNKPLIFEINKIDFWQVLPFYWDGNKKVRDISIRERHFRIEESPLKIEVREYSNNGRSYNLMDLDKILLAFEMLFYPHFHSFKWHFPQWAFNKDHCEIRLDGLESITFQEVKGTIYRWYEKNGLNATREEIHGSTSFSLDNILCMLDKGFKVPLGMADLRDQVRSLKEESKKDRKMMRRLERVIDLLIDAIHEKGGQKSLHIRYNKDFTK